MHDENFKMMFSNPNFQDPDDQAAIVQLVIDSLGMADITGSTAS